MASAYIFICAAGNGTTIPNVVGQLVNDLRAVPHCPSGGMWQLIEYAEPASAFDPANLDPAILAQAFGAGFLTLGIGLVLIAAIRAIVSAVKRL